MRLNRRFSRIGFMIVAIAGCSDEGGASRRELATTSGPAPGSGAEAKATPPAGSNAKDSATAGRKIIYNARVDLVTEDLTALESKLARLVEASKGYVADSMVSGKSGDQRGGSWKVRVPVDGYDSFLKAAVGLGELVSLKADAQDVSEEYYDLEARLSNKKVEEARLIKLLTEATGKLDEVLKVEQEISRVREEVERFQGRLRALANLTALATVTISAREVQDYVPPRAPTFSTRIARAFGSSVDSLRQFGEGAVVFFVVVAPWIPVIAIVLVPILIAGRRASRRS